VSDDELREAERHRNDNQARYLKARLRAGTLTRGQLAIAAYVGHEPAGEVIGEMPDRSLPQSATKWHPTSRFHAFVKDLPAPAALTAAIAAARAVQLATCFEHRRDCTRSRCVPIRAVIDAATRYRDDQTDDAQTEWDTVCTDIGNDMALWLPVPYCTEKLYRANVLTACDEAGVYPVRREVCRQIIEWVLGDPGPCRQAVRWALHGVPEPHTAVRSDDPV